MTTLYKSASFQTYADYVIYPVVIGACLYCLMGIFLYGNFGLFNIAMILIFIFCLISATESLLKLRYIEVTENYILVKSIIKMRAIKFKDVAYVYSLISFRGTYLVLWYRDTETQKLEVVLVRPEMEKMFSNYLNTEAELAITKYIKEKAMQENSGYLNANKRRWFLFSINPYF